MIQPGQPTPTTQPPTDPATQPTAELERPARRQLRMLRPHLDHLPPLHVPAGYQLRTYRPGDERPWGAIMEASNGIGQDWTVEKVRERIVEREQFDPHGLFFITSDADGGLPVASACAWVTTPGERAMGNVHMVCSLDAHRGRGLGRLVTLAVLHRLRERGFTQADLTTDDFRLAAIKSYLGLGFIPIYLPNPDHTDNHELRWSAIFAILLTPRAAS